MSNTEVNGREDWIIREAQMRPSAARAAFLDAACTGDMVLRERVEGLLLAQAQASDVLGPTVVEHSAPANNLSAEEGPGAVIGRYKLLEKIGEGGFGAVYVAEQKEPVKRRVAIKIIKLGMDTRQVVARFGAERQALALMDHPNIAKVLDGGATELGRPFFVMELVRGIPITQYCDENNLGMPERLRLFTLVCRAIQHAHQKGIIHRDIKPSNILVAVNDGVPVPKVIDFGIAKATQQELTEKTVYTQLQQFIGTPAYMSPEQAEMSGLDIDTRSDIYSLGVLLYELLVGRTPFDARELLESGLEVMRRTIREKEPVRPSTRLGSMPEEERTTTAKRRAAEVPKLINLLQGDLDWIVMKCLAKDRTRRYDTANGLAMDIQRHLSCEPVLARPPSKLYEFQTTVRRHRLGFAAAAAIIFVLAIGITLTTWQAVEATKARKVADLSREQALAAQKLAETARANEAEMRRLAEARAYAGDMNLAQHALAGDNLGFARELLDRYRPKPGQPDRRGWEWRYLWQRSRSDALYTLCQQSNGISGLAVSHDGKRLAIQAGGVSVWNLTSRRQVMPAVESKEFAAFSPVKPLLAMWDSVDSGSPERRFRFRFWNTETERFVSDPLSPDSVASGGLEGLAFTPDGQTLVTASIASGSDPNQLTHWRMSDGKRLATYPINIRQPGVGMPVSIARGTNLVALAEEDRWIRVIDLNSGSEKFRTQAPGKGWLETVALSADGRILAASLGTDETTIRLWDVASGQELGVLDGHRAYVIALAFWPDGKTLASAGADQTIRIWDVKERRPLTVLRGHRGEIHRLALLPDNITLISGAKDGTVMVWDTAAVRHQKSIVTLPSKVIGFWAPAIGGDSILTVEDHGWLTRWHGQEFQEAESLFQISPDPQGVCLSADQRLLATGATNGSVKLWDVPQRKFLREIRISTGPVWPHTFLADNTRLAVCNNPGRNELAIHDLTTADRISASPASEIGKGGWGQRATISRDGRWCFAYAKNGAGILRGLPSGRETESVSGVGLSDAAFSPDGKLLACAFGGGFARLWDVPTLKERATLGGILRGAHSVAFSPDGSRLAMGSGGDESLKIWDLENRQSLLTLPGEGGPCGETAFSADGNILATLHAAGTLDIWRVPTWAEIEAAEKGTEGNTQ
jgi:eukaryotic-like serine/threonine-protein kinase